MMAGTLFPPLRCASALVLILSVACTGSGDPGCRGLVPGTFVAAEGEACKSLSSYGLFQVADGRIVPSPGVVEYQVHNALFSDYTVKNRLIALPEGGQIRYGEDGVFEFPPSSVIAKTFSMPANLKSPSADLHMLETRLLIRREEGWETQSYTWKADQSDAIHEPLGGRKDLEWIDLENRTRRTSYLIPNVNQCAECHGRVEPMTSKSVLEPIGAQAKHLHAEPDPEDGFESEVARLASLGLLVGVPDDLATVPALPSWQDPTAGLNERARAYLDINCAHCHLADGSASSSGLLLAFEEQQPWRYGVCKPPIRGAEASPVTILPGEPESSDLFVRVRTTSDKDLMPRIARTVVHEKGAELLSEWIQWLGTDEAVTELGIGDPSCGIAGLGG